MINRSSRPIDMYNILHEFLDNITTAIALNLSSGKINDGDIATLVEALKDNDCQEGLYVRLWDNNIRNADVELFAKLLASDSCPRSLMLDLRYNKISDAGANAILQALRTIEARGKRSHLSIHLAGNNISSKKLAAIEVSLAKIHNLPLEVVHQTGRSVGIKELGTAIMRVGIHVLMMVAPIVGVVLLAHFLWPATPILMFVIAGSIGCFVSFAPTIYNWCTKPSLHVRGSSDERFTATSPTYVSASASTANIYAEPQQQQFSVHVASEADSQPYRP